MKQRIEYIDLAKSVCIIIVVMGHILQYDLDGEGTYSLVSFILCFHMPLFMMLSGYVAALSTKIPKWIGGGRKKLFRLQHPIVYGHSL